MCCFDDHAEKINLLAQTASELFDVEVEKNLTLLTIRHYNEETINNLIDGKVILLEQKTMATIQMIMR